MFRIEYTKLKALKIDQKISKKDGRKAETKPTSVFFNRKGQQPFPNSEHKHKNVQLLYVLTFIVRKVLTFIVSKVLTFIVSKTHFTSQKLFNFQQD